jgi:hypothetical protein
MTYAAKYYALSAFWATWHFADPKHYRRLQDAMGMAQHLDYKQGAWMSALHV